MDNFWLAVVVSIIATLIYIWFSVFKQFKQGESAGNAEKDFSTSNQPRYSMFGLAIVLLTIPFGYYFLGSHEKQLEWQTAQQQLLAIQSGEQLEKNQNEIQDLVLSLRTAVDTDPLNGELWFMLAEVYFQLRMTDMADAALARALRIEMRPDWLVANAQVLTARSQAADIDRAEFLLQQAVQIQPSHQSALLTLGFVQLRLKKYDQAILNWERLKEILQKSGNDVSRIQKQIDSAKQKWLEISTQ